MLQLLPRSRDDRVCLGREGLFLAGVRSWWKKRLPLPLGTWGLPFLQSPLSISHKQAKASWHIIGTSGSGKSYMLAHLFLMLYRRGYAVTLIDPHGDLAKLVLSHLVAEGAYRDPASFERILYLDLPAAERENVYLPFNVLAQDG